MFSSSGPPRGLSAWSDPGGSSLVIDGRRSSASNPVLTSARIISAVKRGPCTRRDITGRPVAGSPRSRHIERVSNSPREVNPTNPVMVSRILGMMHDAGQTLQTIILQSAKQYVHCSQLQYAEHPQKTKTMRLNRSTCIHRKRRKS